MRLFNPHPLVTRAEFAFWRTLKEALPEFDVCPQVCMGAVIEPPKHLEWITARRWARRPYASLFVDFVIFDPADNRIVCLVEVDDWTHDKKKWQDEQRDKMTAQAGYYTIRWDVRRLPSPEDIRSRILETNGLGPHPKSTFMMEKHSVARRRQTPGQVVASLLGLLVMYFVVTKVVLPNMFSGIQENTQKTLKNISATQAKAQQEREAQRQQQFQQANHDVRVPPRGAVHIKAWGCIPYGDATAISLGRTQCDPVEDVSFVIKDLKAVQEWVTFNKDRVLPRADCVNYKPWADELLATDGDAGDKVQRLHNLFSDALVKGCLKAPW